MKQVNYTVPEDDNEFVRCIKFVLEQECRRNKDGTLDDGYVNDPHDPGGETKYGISKKAYPNLNIKELTLEDALAIYHRDYWSVAKSLEFPLNVCVLDTAVNQGKKKAMQFLLASKNDWKSFIHLREQHYLALYDGAFRNNPKRDMWRKFWFKRIANLRKFITVELKYEAGG